MRDVRRAMILMLVVLAGVAGGLLLTGGLAGLAVGYPALAGDPAVEPDLPALAVEAEEPWRDVAEDRVHAPDRQPLLPPHRRRPGVGPETLSPTGTAEAPPGLVQLRDLRRRLGEAAELGRRAKGGDAAAGEEVGRRLGTEADPRVREALATGETPNLGRFRWAPPELPTPAKAAEPGEVRAYWLTPANARDGTAHDGTYESQVSIAADGRATVSTVYEPTDGPRWRVRYAAWAYRDAQGRLVVDARGQEVECLEKPPWGWWSPDSMVIGADGLIDLIDDKHDPGEGTRGAKSPG